MIINKIKKFIIIFCLICFHMQGNTKQNNTEQKKIYITADSWQENSIKIANSICKAINKDHKQNNLICEISTNTISTTTWLKLIQCDKYQQNTKNLSNLVTIMPLYIEKLSIITKTSEKKNIRNILINPTKIAVDDTKVINIIKFISNNLGISSQISTQKISPKDYADNLCSGKVDAIATIKNHPNQDIFNINKICTFTISNIDQPTLQLITKNDNAYMATTISGGIYPGSPNNIRTLGVATIIMANKDLSEDIINNVKNSIIKNLPLVSREHYLNLKDEIQNIKCPEL